MYGSAGLVLSGCCRLRVSAPAGAFRRWRRCGMSSPAAVASPVLEVRDLRKSYDDGRIEALRGVDLSIEAGHFVAISGPSGSGKSTLLQLLGGLDTPTHGEVLFRNAQLKASDLDDYRASKVGFIFQAFYLLPTLRAVE